MVKYLTNTPKPVARQQQKQEIQEIKEKETKRKLEGVIGKIDKKGVKRYIFNRSYLL